MLTEACTTSLGTVFEIGEIQTYKQYAKIYAYQKKEGKLVSADTLCSLMV